MVNQTRPTPNERAALGLSPEPSFGSARGSDMEKEKYRYIECVGRKAVERKMNEAAAEGYRVVNVHKSQMAGPTFVTLELLPENAQNPPG